MLIESMARSRWPWTNRMYVCVCLYFCVLEFLGVIRVRCSVRPWSDPHFLSQYTIMVMVGVRLSWLNPNDILDSGRTDCTFVFLWLAFDRVIGVRSRQGHNSTFFPPVKIHLNGDAFRAFILVKPMARSRWPWTNRLYVYVHVLDLVFIRVPSTPLLLVKICYNGDRWCAFILVASMNDLVGPGRTGGTFVFLCAWLWNCYLGLM